jgi:protein RecA
MTTTTNTEEVITSDGIADLDKLLSANKKAFKGAYKTDNDVVYVPSYSPSFNNLVGGIPLGRYMSLVGNEQSGKSTLYLMFAKSVIDAGYGVLFIDAEHTMTKEYVIACGITEEQYNSNFRLAQTNVMEEVLWLMQECVKNIPEIKLIIIDSLPALNTEKENEDTDGDVTKKNIGGCAMYLTKFLPKLKPYFIKNQVTLMFTRQYRANIGVMYGSNVKESGGHALDYYTDVKLTLKGTQMKKGTETIGLDVAVTAKKSKVGGTFDTIQIPILFPKYGFVKGKRQIINVPGVDYMREFVREASEKDVLVKKGAFYTITIEGEPDIKKQGEDNVRDYLLENPEIYKILNERLMNQ